MKKMMTAAAAAALLLAGTGAGAEELMGQTAGAQVVNVPVSEARSTRFRASSTARFLSAAAMCAACA